MDYRIVKRTEPVLNTEYYDILEIFYNEDGTPQVLTEGMTKLRALSVEGLKEQIKEMQKAFEKPILENVWGLED